MDQFSKWLTIKAVITAFLVTCKAQRLYPCDSSGYRDVVENTSATFHCDGYRGTVDWAYQGPASIASIVYSRCNATACTRPTFPAFSATYISDGNSSFTTTQTSRDVRVAGGKYACGVQDCRVHIIVPAAVSKPTHTVTPTDQGYSVRCTADVTKVYSSRGLYSCVWQLGAEKGSVTPSLQPTPSNITNTSDRTGRCDVTLPLPSNTGSYPCTVTVSPGNTRDSSDSIQIVRPPAPVLSCPSDPVPENSNVSCTCQTDTIGQPGGRLRIYTGTNNNVITHVVSGQYDVSSVTMTWPVTRSDDNVRRFRCDNNWALNVTGDDVTITIAYGPDTVAIEGNTTFYTDTSGSRSLTLTCRPSGAGPSSALTFTWNIPCDVSSQRGQCTFRPRPPSNGDSGDVNKTITCTVTNTKNNNQRKQSSVTLDLKYPPPSPPQISGYTNYSVLYQGDNLTLTCSVTGGDPAVTSVTLTCPGQHDNGPSAGQSSSLPMTSLSDDDNNLRCTCSGQWAVPSYYTSTDSRTLRVHYPPSAPVINRADGSSLPFLEKENVTLTCTVTSTGNPPATLSWSETGADNQPLRLISVSKGDNQRNVTCRASNDFTTNKGGQLVDVFTLHVYYGPYVNVTSAEGNTCQMTLNPAQCVVTEGGRVHLKVKADSNPNPQRYVWQASPTFSLDRGTASDLDLGSIQRNHSGVYQVTVETEKPNASDNRLPLTATLHLTVLVTYSPSAVTLTSNNSRNLTVSENTTVTLDCQSRGRPTPELQLTQRGSLLERAEGGELSVSEVSTVLTHTIRAAQCHNTGLYTCNANNGVGGTLQDTVQLYVNCKPRRNSASSSEPMEVNYQDKPQFVEFQLVAFPVPYSYSFSRLVNGSYTNITGGIALMAKCSTTGTDYNVTCNVTVSDVKSTSAEGMYIFKAANAFGHEEFRLRVKVNGITGSSDNVEKGLNIAAVAGSVVAVLAVVAVVVVVVVVLRNRRNGSKTSHSKHTGTNGTNPREEPEMIVNELYGTSAAGARKDDDDDVMIENTAYVSSADFGNYTSKNQGNAYEDVELNSKKNAPGKPAGVREHPVSKTNEPSTSANKDPKPLNASFNDDPSNLYALPQKPGRANAEKQKPDVKPKPAKKSKPEKPKDKPTDEKQLLRTGEYSNVAIAPLTMSPHVQGGSVYENYGFENEESKTDKPSDENKSRTVNDDGLVYTTVAFSEKQLKKAQDPPPEREETEYAGIDFTRKVLPTQAHD